MGALQDLGVSTDGISISFRKHNEDVYTDTFGPQVPIDVQVFLEDVYISCDLIDYNQSTMYTLMATTLGGTKGVMPAAGTLMIQQSQYYRVLLRPAPFAVGTGGVTADADCWNFLACYLVEPDDTIMSSRRQTHKLTWRALPLYLGTTGQSSSGSVLYNNLCT